ncbi:MAG: protease SohB [Bdellovibrionales bacterium]|nr:protease SohB [Bdellovibrionales bacterium]
MGDFHEIRLDLHRESIYLSGEIATEESTVEYWIEIAVFAGKVGILVGGLLVILIGLALLVSRKQQERQEHLEVQDLNEKLRSYTNLLKSAIFTKREWKDEAKKQKKEFKEKEKLTESRPRLFVLDFEGDIKAAEVDRLRHEISIVLNVAQPHDEAVVRVESAGGMVHSYGLAAAQLLRLRQHNIPLTICVDKIAASGGYLMACTANKIVAAPFAIVGSIGVLAQVPNFHRLLKKHDVDYEEITSGEYKRTVSLMGEITPKGREKFAEQITDTHRLFKDFVSKCRPQLNLEQVGTGEHWFGERAIALNLVDELATSDEFLMSQMAHKQIYHLELAEKKSLSEKLSEALKGGAANAGASALRSLLKNWGI